jgi:hypothetical protein
MGCNEETLNFEEVENDDFNAIKYIVIDDIELSNEESCNFLKIIQLHFFII